MVMNITNKSQFIHVKNLSKLDFNSSKKFLIKDLSFSVNEGDLCLLQGPNGSGKTTLLKIINNIYPYEKGEISIYHKISPILNNSMPFSEHLDMIANIKLMGSLMGFQKEIIYESIEKIISFSEIESQNSLMNFSTGMRSRLSFSILRYLNHPIIMLDEVMANIDHSFKNKILNTIDKFIFEENRAVLMVDHNNILENYDKNNLKIIKLFD